MAKYSAAEGTKIKMINAAGELAAKMGLDNVSTRAVANRSGENIGSIHYHFGGKDGLFEAVVHDAISCCVDKEYYHLMEDLNEGCVTPGELSKILRIIVQSEINDLFRQDRPQWHSQVIYQLLQREDALFEIFQMEVMNPGMEGMRKFFRMIDSDISEDEVLLRMIILKMPIFAHANYMSLLLRQLNLKSYPEKYLKKMEDLLVRQTQLLMGLPEDLEN
jgi:AcrR family transcriptional regulator